MKVVIIGSGNVATVLGARIKEAGHTVLQVLARREEPAARLAKALECGYATRWQEIDKNGDIYVVALSDRALQQLDEVLHLPGKLVVHTAGAVATNALLKVSASCGVLYPLQSFRSEARPFPEFPLLVAANQPEDLATISTFAHTISSQVQEADDTSRLKLHVAAVLVNNFTNYLYSRTADFCKQEDLDFSLLLPIIMETAERLRRFDPQQLQTGPALRGDRATIDKHLKILSNYPNLSDLYKLFTIQIEEYHRTGGKFDV